MNTPARPAQGAKRQAGDLMERGAAEVTHLSDYSEIISTVASHMNLIEIASLYLQGPEIGCCSCSPKQHRLQLLLGQPVENQRVGADSGRAIRHWNHQNSANWSGFFSVSAGARPSKLRSIPYCLSVMNMMETFPMGGT